MHCRFRALGFVSLAIVFDVTSKRLWALGWVPCPDLVQNLYWRCIYSGDSIELFKCVVQ